jgi:hypothetical protein
VDDNSWLKLERADPAFALDPAIAAADPFAARDCGWVEQMRPFVRHYSRPGERVLDPFCGFATTLVAAHVEGRRGLGFEIDPGRVAASRERLAKLGAHHAEVLAGSIDEARAPLPAIDLCLTSLPYFGCGWTGSAQADAQLYAVDDYARYLQRVRAIFRVVRDALRPGRHCIVMAENLVLGGRAIPLAWDVARVLGEWFVPLGERVLLYDRPRAPLPPLEHGSNRSHEYALIFRRERVQADVAEGHAVLGALRAAGVDFVVHGSFAALLEGHEAAPADLDLVVPAVGPHLARTLAILAGRGYDLRCWDEPVALPLDLDRWRGRRYFRAHRLDRRGSGLQVDVMFETGEAPASEP